MEPATIGVGQLAETSKCFVRRLFTIVENRLELLTVELQEERERLLRRQHRRHQIELARFGAAEQMGQEIGAAVIAG